MERPRTPRTILLAAAAALALGGCALTLSGPDANRPRDRVPRCDTGKALVATDAILGSVLGISSLVALGEDAGGAALLPAVTGAAFVLSAVSANGRVNDCRAAIAEYESGGAPRLFDREDARRAMGPPGSPALPPAAQAVPMPMPAAPPPVAALPAAPPSTPPSAPPAALPPSVPPPRPAPPSSPPAAADPWAEFWKELP